jgi:hypothetical protein
MTDMAQKSYEHLVSNYEAGAYTRGETASAVLRLLHTCTFEQRAIIWAQFPAWLAEQASQILSTFDETAEPFALRPANPLEQHEMLTELKRWWLKSPDLN